MCQCCVQCSILAFYLRIGIADIGWHHLRRIIYALIGFSIVINTVLPACQLCYVTKAKWLVQSQKYLMIIWFTYGSLNLLMDLIIWFIPLPSVISIMHNLSARKKIMLVLAFAVGLMSVCSATLRVSFRKYIFGLGADPTYNAPIINVLLVSEVSLAIGCVSVVTLQPLVAKVTEVFNRLRGKPTSTNTNGMAGVEVGVSPGLAQLAGNKGGFGQRVAVNQELAEWKDDVTDNKLSQSVQQTPLRDGEVELGSIVAHVLSNPRRPDPAHRINLHSSTLAATTDHGPIHRSLSSSSGETLGTTTIGSTYQGGTSRQPCDPLPSSESTINLTNADTNSVAHAL